jgi:hypothetical protein
LEVESQCLIQSFFVKKEFQNKGVDKKLINFSIKQWNAKPMNKTMIQALMTGIVLILFGCQSSRTTVPVSTAPRATPAVTSPEPTAAAQSSGPAQTPEPSPYFSGDGGKGKSIAILVPRASGLTEAQDYIPALVQGELVSNFSGYSALSVLDRQRLRRHL